MKKAPCLLRPPFLSILFLGSVLVTTALFARPMPAYEAPSEIDTGYSMDVDTGLFGHSGKLRAIIGIEGEPLSGIRFEGTADSLVWRRSHGKDELPVELHDSSLLPPKQPGSWILQETILAPTSRPNLLASLRPIRRMAKPELRRSVEGMPIVLALRRSEEKEDGVLEGYRIGDYPPRPRGYGRSYEPPRGYIEVTEQTRGLHVSENFTLGEFLTKNQHDKWPKFLVLDLRLVDKLELVIEEMRAMDHEANGLFVMSGYRTPHYNGPGTGGRSRFSRHIYGDAADVWLDESGDGRMDDLNGDGRSDIADARILAGAASRVQDRYPDLAGGIGVYGPREPRGPFVHIDIRGRRARW